MVKRRPSFVLTVVAAAVAIAACRSETPNRGTAGGADGPSTRTSIVATPVDSQVFNRFRNDYERLDAESRPIFERYLPILGPAPILAYLEERFPACHPQAHDLGKTIYAISGDVEEALRQCDTRCTSGCMHGVVAQAFGGGSISDIGLRMNDFCAGGEMAGLHRPGNCAHGIGHALMFVSGGDTDRAIQGCLGFAAEPMQYYCGTGVFMERFVDRADSVLSDGSDLAPCDSESLFPAACYRYKGAELLKALGDAAAVAARCAGLDRLQRLGCFHGLGYASMEEVYLDPQSLPAVCGRGDRDDRVVCLEGAIEKLSELNEGRARAACAFLGEELQPPCERAVGRKMYDITKPTFPLYYDSLAISRRKERLAQLR